MKMSKNCIGCLTSNCKALKRKYKGIIDFILYGSYVKGKSKTGDIDLLVLFLDQPLNRRLEITQELKGIAKKDCPDIDIKSANIAEFFSKDFLARQGILVEGISLLSDKPFAEALGFKGYALFSFNLKGLEHKEKIKFNYALYGRKGKGFLNEVKGTYMGRGVVEIPVKESDNFEEFLQRWNVTYKIKTILESSY